MSTFPVINPATEQHLADVHDATSQDWMQALSDAVTAGQSWSQVTPRQRATVLNDIFAAVAEREDDFATTMTKEMGKPLREARGEVAYGNEYFRWFAEEAVRIDGRLAQSPAGVGTILVTHEPVGPVLAITPWNFPLAMATRKIAPALAAGCSIIVKPAQETPLTMVLLGEVIAEVLRKHNIDEKLVQVITTSHASDMSKELMADPRLRKVTFTGSTGVGRHLVRQSADNLQRTSMELGGNAPFVVAEDADLDLVLTCALQAKMRNGGEACIAANRFLVASSIEEEFTKRLTEHMEGVVMGDGMDDATTLGPIITKKQRDGIAELVDDAVSKGAQVLTGGTIPEGKGFFYPATVLTKLPKDARILSEEIFGPVATVTTFDSLDEGIAMANDTEFGLAAYGFSENIHTAQKLAKELKAGMVGINRGAISDPAAPFGGIKQSGFGREGGSEGIEEYLDIKYIALQ
ncbi:NAD-dependent succinate-semialdehyde dehydrogenase [Corynebacterium aquilae]|nr:NAD-dependent succinate-semialdehyde dehydrogenase [Corynebacterium aquilae]